MAGQEKDAYVALITARDPQIRALLDQGFEFVMNALKAAVARNASGVSMPPRIRV